MMKTHQRRGIAHQSSHTDTHRSFCPLTRGRHPISEKAPAQSGAFLGLPAPDHDEFMNRHTIVVTEDYGGSDTEPYVSCQTCRRLLGSARFPSIHLAERAAKLHDFFEHVAAPYSLGIDRTETGLRMDAVVNSCTIRTQGNVIESIAVFEPRRDGMATAALSMLVKGTEQWQITPTLSPEAEAFWAKMRLWFPTAGFTITELGD